jgi:hypothetical protein
LNIAIGARELFEKNTVWEADELDTHLSDRTLRVSLAHPHGNLTNVVGTLRECRARSADDTERYQEERYRLDSEKM